MKTRTLKIETAGDFWRGKVSPKIRLTGQWLERAGFKPGNRVEIKLIEHGKITLEFMPAYDNNSLRTHSATLPIVGDLL